MHKILLKPLFHSVSLGIWINKKQGIFEFEHYVLVNLIVMRIMFIHRKEDFSMPFCLLLKK